jgi:hypothetical protein
MLAGIFGEGNYELLLDAQACRLKIVMVSWDARLVREAKAMAAGVIPANLEMVAERRMTAALCAKTSIGGAMASAAIYGLK